MCKDAFAFPYLGEGGEGEGTAKAKLGNLLRADCRLPKAEAKSEGGDCSSRGLALDLRLLVNGAERETVSLLLLPPLEALAWLTAIARSAAAS